MSKFAYYYFMMDVRVPNRMLLGGREFALGGANWRIEAARRGWNRAGHVKRLPRRDVGNIACNDALVELAWPADPQFWIGDHFVPLRDPAD